MRAFALIAGGLAACSYTPNLGVQEDPTPDAATFDVPTVDVPPGSGRKKTITIDPNNVDADLSGFPVWIALDDPDLGARAQQNASDIHFTRSDGMPLPYEIVDWNQSIGHLEAWVRVDLSNNQATVFDLRYGDPATAHPPMSAMVFDNAFSAVWHLDGTAAAGVVTDATGARDGNAAGGLSSGDRVSGKLGSALDFDGANEQITFVNPITANTAHTISAWVSQRTANNFDAIVVVGNSNANQSRWFYTRYTSSDVAAGFYQNDWDAAGTSVENGGFVLLHWVFEGGNRVSRMYRDGAEVGSFTHNAGIATTGTGGFIGYAPTGWGSSVGLNGILDEVRIASVARVPEWIDAEFQNQNTPSSFYSVGAEANAP